MLIMTCSVAETAKQQASSATALPGLAAATSSTAAVLSPLTSAASPTLNFFFPSSPINPSEPQTLLARRRFPAVVFVLLYSSPHSDSVPSIRGIFMSITNANQECRRLRSLDCPPPRPETLADVEERIKLERRRDMGRELERWQNDEGVECWVEVHAVTPRQWPVDRRAGSISGSNVAGSGADTRKLYQNEEEDDEIEEDEEYSGEQ